MRQLLYQLYNEWSILRNWIFLCCCSNVTEVWLMAIIWKRMFFVTCLDWKISPSIFVRLWNLMPVRLLYQAMEWFDLHWQMWQNIRLSLMSIISSIRMKLIVTSIRNRMDWSNMNIWVTSFRMIYSRMFEMFHYTMSDRLNIHFSCVWQNHFRWWKYWMLRIQKRKWRNNMVNYVMKINVHRSSTILRSRNFIFRMFTMITLNNFSSRRKHYLTTICLWAFVTTNLNE